MSLEVKIMDNMKEAMKAKDSLALEALRAIKSAIILAKTEAGAGDGLSEDQEIKMLQRLVKMRLVLFLVHFQRHCALWRKRNSGSKSASDVTPKCSCRSCLLSRKLLERQVKLLGSS